MILRDRPNTLIDYRDSYCLKGLMMIMIIALHIIIKLVYHYEIKILNYTGWPHWGAMAVGIFFFLSGFGMTHSFLTKGVNPRKVIWNIINNLIYPFLFAFAVYLLINAIFFEPHYFSSQLLTLSIPETTSWFFKVILIIYIITPIVFSVLPKHIIPLFITIGVITYIIIAITLGAETFWYNSIICYPIGVLASYITNNQLFTPPIFTKPSQSQDKLSALKQNLLILWSNINKSKKWIMLILIMTTCLWFRAFQYDTLDSVLFCLLAIILLPHLKITNDILFYIGKNSFIFYITHIALYNILARIITSPILYALSVALLSILCVWVYLLLVKLLSQANSLLRPVKT